MALACIRITGAFSLLSALPLHAAGRQMLKGHLPEAVSQLKPEGSLQSTQHLRLAIGLPLRNPTELSDLIRHLYDPADPNYRQYLTPSQFTERFGPTVQDYQAVIAFAQSNGLTVTALHPNRLIVDVEGAVSDIEKAFHVTMLNYQHPKEARKFFAPDVEPSVDLTVPVLYISGLNNYWIPHPNLNLKPAGLSAGVTPNSGSAPGGAYAGGDFRAAYLPGTTLTGSGQSVGLLQFDGYYASDITAYKTQFGLPNIPLINVPIDGGVTTPGTGNSEVCLDIEMVLSMAPGITSIYVYEAPNPSPWVDLLSRMANDNLCKQLSCSWGGGSPDPNSEIIFQQMATQGQSFFNATGDSDAFTGSIPFPSDSPNITEVGATTLTTTGSGGSYVSETVWNWGYVTSQKAYIGSSGGISTYYSIPSWQQGVSMATNQGSATLRNVPDVALAGDNIYVLYNNGSSGNFGGTSCAAPLWAGLTALINQRAVSNGRATVGFLNPALYALGSGTSYASTFHDITTGNNFWSSSPSKFSAVTGYDLCAGWGTPAGGALIDALAGPFDGLQVTPATSYVSTGLIGGPFAPAASSYTLMNSGSTSLSWSAGTTQGWLSLSATGGTLLAGGSTMVTVALNTAANLLAAGTYSDTVTVSDVSTGISQTRPVRLTVMTPSPVLSVTPVTPFAPIGFPGGPFNPSSATYSVANTGNIPLTWAVSNTSSWLTVLPSGGTLAVGGSTTVTASVLSSANSLSSGSYSDTLVFTNVTNGVGNTSIGCALYAVLDYYTQLFATGSNNTANHSFTFTPNGSANYYIAYCDGTTAFPTSPTGGTALTLLNDAYATVTLSGTATVKLYGTAYNKFYVGSNGYVTFGSGDTSNTATLATHFSKPRIAGLFRDLNPHTSGTVSWRQLSDRVAVTFQNVPAYRTLNSNNFQIEMFFDGRIRITVLSIASTDGLIGLSQGLGQSAVFLNSNFLGYPKTPLSVAFTLPATLLKGLQTTGTVSISGTASGASVISLASSDPSKLTAPATVTIPAGSTSATFTLSAPADTLTDGIQIITLTGTCAGMFGASANINVLDSNVHHFTVGAVGSPQFTGVPFATTVTAVDVNGVVIPSYSGTPALSGSGSAGDVAILPPMTGTFLNGVWTGSVTAGLADTNVILAVNDGAGHTGSSNLFNILANLPVITVTPATNGLSSGLLGGPFTPSTFAYTILNSGTGVMTWSVTNPQPWLSLSATTGTLVTGSGVVVTATLNASANALASGSYSDTVSFTNVTNGTGNTTRTLSLTVITPNPVLNVTPATGLASTGTTGGPFLPSNTVYTLSNTGNSPMNWSAAKTQSWLTLSSTTGTLASGSSISLTASINSNANSLASGSYTDTVTLLNLSNGNGNTSRAVALNVSMPPPSITSSLTKTGTNGSAFSYQITASNSPTSYGATGLPTGLSVSSSTGLITGTPTQTGTFNSTISAINTGGTGSANLVLNVLPPPPVITGTLAATGTNGSAFSYQITATNSPTSYGATGLPTGLSVSSSTGLITGTPTQTGTFNSTISAINTGGTGTAVLFLNIQQGPVISVTPAGGFSLTGTAGGPFAAPAVTFTLTNSGTGALNWQASNTTGWLALSSSGGTLSTGSSAIITATLTSSANTLVSGSYNETITFINQTNGAGNTMRSGFLLIVPDLTPPVLVVTTPDYTTTNQAAVTLQGTATDADGISSVVANGVAATTADSFANWSATVGNLSVGINVLTIIAADRATPANTASVLRNVLYYTGTSSLFGNGLPDAWKIAHGLDPFSNTGANSATGTPAGDGISNLMKYALNLDPWQNGTKGLPYISTALNAVDNQIYLIFNYRRIIGGGGLTYIVESSTNLADWTSSASDLEEISATPDADGVTEDVQVRVHPSLTTPAAGSKFIRLRVITAP